MKRVVKLTVTNSGDDSVFEMIAAPDESTSSSIIIEDDGSQLVIAESMIVSKRKGETIAVYKYRNGDFVTIDKQISPSEVWTGE